MTDSTHIMPTYARLDVEFDHGEGVWLFDKNGEKYLDAISGIGVCALGHAHPAITQAISEQAAKLVHTSNLYHIGNQEALADALCAASNMENVFFSNSGAEANEAAIKLARLHGNKKGLNTPTVLVFDNAFHGRTLATLTASGNRKIQAGFEPLVQGFTRAPLNDLEAVKNIAQNNKNIAAVLVEPIQGEGGINIASDEFMNGLHALCQEHDWLLMLDEVQTGNGRTGKYFAYQHFNWLPDVVTTAKGLGNGLPIGACLTAGKAKDLFGPGNHGSTYGGNPLAAKAALTTVNTLVNDGVIANAETMGNYLLEQFTEKLGTKTQVSSIDGKGLMLGIKLNQECGHLVAEALSEKLLINVTAGNVIRLLPPLIINQAEADLLIQQVCNLVTSLEQMEKDCA
jgi:acetylornithine aminotransferase